MFPNKEWYLYLGLSSNADAVASMQHNFPHYEPGKGANLGFKFPEGFDPHKLPPHVDVGNPPLPPQ